MSDIEKINDLDKEFATFRDKLDKLATKLPNVIRFPEPGKQMNHNNQNAQTPTFQSAINSRSRRVKRQQAVRCIVSTIVSIVFLVFYVSIYYIANSKHWNNPSEIALIFGIFGALALICMVATFTYTCQCCNPPAQHNPHQPPHQQAQHGIELPMGEPQGQVAATIPSDDVCAICLNALSLSNVRVYLYIFFEENFYSHMKCMYIISRSQSSSIPTARQVLTLI